MKSLLKVHSGSIKKHGLLHASSHCVLHVPCSHTATLTKEMLLQLFSHSMELKIWDTKDKVSPRARFDRPKAFRIPASRGPDDPESLSGGGVQQLVANQHQSFENSQPKQSRIFPGKDQSEYMCRWYVVMCILILPPQIEDVWEKALDTKDV